MDGRKFLDALKKFFKGVWEVLKYYVPIICVKIWEGLKFLGRGIAKGAVAFSRWFKRYLRKMIKQTRKGDYSMVIYSAVTLIVAIVLIVLLVNAVGGKKNKKTKTKLTTEAITTEDPEIAKRKEMISQAKKLYQDNQAFLILVNDSHMADSAYSFEHHTLNCGKDIDKRMLDNLKNMLSACNSNGHEYNIISAYRDRNSQQALYEETVAGIVKAEGCTQDQAIQAAKSKVQNAGCSEHETGLAIDISSVNTKTLDQYVAEEGTNQWLMQNSYKYGFIVRYPADKVSITGVSFEPWHYRYVGVETATFIYNNNLCLEEFYDLVNAQ